MMTTECDAGVRKQETAAKNSTQKRAAKPLDNKYVTAS